MSNHGNTSTDVSWLHAVKSSPPQEVEGLHRSRLLEYGLSQVVGTGIAIGTVGLARNLLPRQMQQLARQVERVGTPFWKNQNPTFILNQSQRVTDYGLMFGAGFLTTLSSQILLARNRREKYEYGDTITISQDGQRVLAGWGVGFLGACLSVALADRYLRTSSNVAVSDTLNKAEAWLDRNVTHNWLVAKDCKLSQLIVSNLSMMAGGAPSSIVGQWAYDQVLSPEQTPQRQHASR